MMNTFRLFVLFLTIISFCPAFGQKDRNVIYKVGVGELIYTPPSEGNPNAAVKVLKDVADVLLSGQTTKQQPQYAEAVRASIVNGLSKVILFRPSDGAIPQEELSNNIPALYADGTIVNISTVSKTETDKDSKGNKTTHTSYHGIISVTVNLKDAYDGTLINSQTFSVYDSDLYWMTSGEKAINNALERLTSKVASFYNQMFPLRASIVEKGEAKKNKQKEVYIDLGASDGVYKGLQFDVFLVKTIAGKEAKTMIGRLKTEEVEGDEISLCKVTKGADKIKTALDEDQTLLITSR
ncbi:hypothetical protein [Parabacteroides sp.]|uniref:hypothetical protein n=1 Tax=Parabacteroides sp. TaxID=1869337 RepID=UPI002579DF40|nr:hypothetical protein [Parabacteroides sp.]